MNLFQRYEEILRRLVTELKALYGARLVACAVYGSVGAARRDRTLTSTC